MTLKYVSNGSRTLDDSLQEYKTCQSNTGNVNMYSHLK